MNTGAVATIFAGTESGRTNLECVTSELFCSRAMIPLMRHLRLPFFTLLDSRLIIIAEVT